MATEEVGVEPARDADSTPRLQLRNLRKTFGDVVAVDDVSLEIGQDEFVVFVGPSGCGKTTTLRCIAGLESPTSGEVVIDGDDITDHKPKDRDIAFVFQEIALFPHMTVRENMRFGLDMKTDLSKAEKNDRVAEVAGMMGIEDLLDRSPAELSGGQQQRVGIGRAMVMEPNVFLLDEPFANLDANLRDRMQTEIKKLQRQLTTSMIFVTHDQEEAMILGDTIVIMNDGNIQQTGSPTEIYNDPANQFVAEFIGSPSTNVLQGRLSTTGDDLRVETDFFELPLDAEPATVDAGDGERVSLAVRPEYLLFGDDGLFEADITLVEHHGEKDAVHLSAGGEELIATVDQGTFDPGQDVVGVGFESDQVWLFDADGERLL